MKTYISDIIPRIKQFSKKIDNLTLLTNQHWVVLDEISENKNVYIFRSNNELLISTNGKVEKAKWEYLGNDSLLIDKKEESYLFKHGFFDENILALKIDSKEEYVFLINENKYDGELNSLEKVIDFLSRKYIESPFTKDKNIDGNNYEKGNQPLEEDKIKYVIFNTDKGIVKVEQDKLYKNPLKGSKVYLGSKLATSGKYKVGHMSYIHIRDGKFWKMTIF